MRSLLATSIGRIHAGQFTSAEYIALADRLQEQVDYVTANCKLPEEADAQLHIVLAEVLEGMDTMKTGADQVQGALRAVVASKRTDGTSSIRTGLRWPGDAAHLGEADGPLERQDGDVGMVSWPRLSSCAEGQPPRLSTSPGTAGEHRCLIAPSQFFSRWRMRPASHMPLAAMTMWNS